MTGQIFHFHGPPDRGYGIKEIASYFGYSTRTIQRKLNHFGIRIRQHRYSLISDEELTEIIADIINEGDDLGRSLLKISMYYFKYLLILKNMLLLNVSMCNAGEIIIDARLKRLGYHIQRYCIREVLQAIIPEEDRAIKRIKRRQYYCRAPLSLVHIDTYNKCIRYTTVKFQSFM